MRDIKSMFFLGWLGKKVGSLRMKMARKTDERLRLTNEIISGIQVIKMYAWEKPFSKLLRNARKYVKYFNNH